MLLLAALLSGGRSDRAWLALETGLAPACSVADNRSILSATRSSDQVALITGPYDESASYFLPGRGVLGDAIGQMYAQL